MDLRVMIRKKFFFLSLLLLNLSCSEPPETKIELGARHEPIPGNGLFFYTGNSFTGYIEQTRKRLIASREDLIDKKNADNLQWIEGNLPFLLTPSSFCKKQPSGKYKKAIVLTHGLTDSPYFMRHIGYFFQKQCFVVLAILLPGHGSRPGDLASVSWREWEKAEQFGIEQAYKFANTVYLGGFSTGAELALNAGAGRDDLGGIFLFSPAIKISGMAFIADFHKLLANVSRRLAWLSIGKDDSPYKYQSLHLNGVSQTRKLINHTRKKLANQGLNIPVFMATSWEDETVDTEAAIETFYTFSNPIKKLLLFSQRRIREKMVQETQLRPGEHQEILSLSHLGIVMPPDDPIYGINGSYKECEYYLNDPNAYKICKLGFAPFLGEQTATNVKKGVVQRIMYNPWWKLTLEEMKKILDEIDTQKPAD